MVSNEGRGSESNARLSPLPLLQNHARSMWVFDQVSYREIAQLRWTLACQWTDQWQVIPARLFFCEEMELIWKLE
jgi:hypothetical protein